MLQAIQTKYVNRNGAGRILVKAPAGRREYGWDHALNAAQNHRAAAEEFALSLEWIESGKPDALLAGVLADGSYAFIVNSAHGGPDYD